MVKIYKWKNDETGIDNKSRTVVSTENVTEERKTEFTIEQKEKELENINKQMEELIKTKQELEAEILKVRQELNISD